MSIFSYDIAAAEYLYHGFRSGGAVVVQRGTLRGDTWTFTPSPNTSDSGARTRITIKPTSDGFELVEALADGEAWVEKSRTHFKRVRP